ncbi:MAG: dTDP-glucose 4,6-dehydratase [Pseudomonadota bacterium]|nr:dTDP-glucose 4,6-dehydratase [Pseudomonadota bacterium]MDE3038668.1 dTDP-glucose 4,6-dehydratase [Pseudomonadota bacterium]
MKNFLVTGGAGFIGSCFVAQAAARGHHAVVLDKLTYAGRRENVDKRAAFIQGDIADRALVLKLLREHAIEAIVNFAAESHVDNSIAGPSPFIETNVTGTFQLLEATREYWDGKKEFRFMQISTDEVYGSLKRTGKFSEASPLRPNSPYSASKAAGDHLARAWHETYGLPAIVTHCTNNYGPRQHPEKLIPNMIRCALAGKPLPVYGDGKNVRDWIHVEDHCNGIWLALEKGNPGEVYDFSGDAETENILLVKNICALLDKKRPRKGSYSEQITFVADRPGHDRRYAIDDAKAQRELGFKCNYTLDKGLETTVEWYLAQIL